MSEQVTCAQCWEGLDDKESTGVEVDGALVPVCTGCEEDLDKSKIRKNLYEAEDKSISEV